MNLLGWLRRPLPGWGFTVAATLMLLLAWSATVLMLSINNQARALAGAQERTSLRADVAKQFVNLQFEGLTWLFALAQLRANFADTNPAAQQAVTQELQQLTSHRSGGVLQVSQVDAQGIARWSSMSGDVAIDLSDRAHIRPHLTAEIGTYVSQPVMGRISQQYTFQITRRDHHADGSLRGVVVLSIDIDKLAGELARVATATGGSLVLLRADGVPLVQSSADPVVLRALARVASGPGGLPARLDTVLTEPGDEPRLLAIRQIDSAPLYVAVSRQVELEQAGYIRYRNTWRLAWLFISLAIVGAGWLDLVRRHRQRVHEDLAAVQQREADLARMLDGMDEAVFVVRYDTDNIAHLIYANATCREMLGDLPPVEPEMHLAWDPPLSEQHKAWMMARRTAGQSHYTVDWQLRLTPEAPPCWVRFRWRMLQDNGRTREAICAILDISTERAAEAAAISTSRLAALGEVSADLAHELSQPLTVISLSAEIATQALAPLPPELAAPIRERQDAIVAMATRARNVIDHLRHFARPPEDGLEAVSLAAVLEGAKLLVGHTLHEDDVKLESSLPEDLPDVSGKQILLEQALINLLLNARDAMAQTNKGGKHIRLSSQVERDYVELMVTDTGPGIPADVLPRLFEPFFTTKGPKAGTGLGLSICHGILTASGGSIRAANAPGGGAVFTLRLRRMGEDPAG